MVSVLLWFLVSCILKILPICQLSRNDKLPSSRTHSSIHKSQNEEPSRQTSLNVTRIGPKVNFLKCICGHAAPGVDNEAHNVVFVGHVSYTLSFSLLLTYDSNHPNHDVCQKSNPRARGKKCEQVEPMAARPTAVRYGQKCQHFERKQHYMQRHTRKPSRPRQNPLGSILLWMRRRLFGIQVLRATANSSIAVFHCNVDPKFFLSGRMHTTNSGKTYCIRVYSWNITDFAFIWF